jgi:hypothetical protein
MFRSCFAIAVLLVILAVPNPAQAQAQAQAQAGASSQFFRHIMFRESPYAPYRGIHPVDTERAPNFAHYRFELDEQQRVTRIRYQINEHAIRGNEVWDSFIWFAPEVRIEYRDTGEVHHYYNIEGQQTVAHGDVWEARYQHDASGRRTALRFFDSDGEPVESEWGVHRYQWQHRNDLVYEKRFGLDEQQRPMRPVLEFYEVELEYDRHGQLAFMRNLGLDGTLSNNESGAAIDRISYDQHGNFVRWQVYDKDGHAVEANRPMVHMGEHLYDEYGNKVGMRGFDRQGRRIPFSWSTFEHIKRYNQHGNMVEHRMYLADGRLNRRLAIDYNEEQSAIKRLSSLDEGGQLVASPMLGGAAMVEYRYGRNGEVERTALNADGSPFQPPSGTQP